MHNASTEGRIYGCNLHLLSQSEETALQTGERPYMVRRIISGKERAGGTEIMPLVYRSPRLNCWTLWRARSRLSALRQRQAFGGGGTQRLTDGSVKEGIWLLPGSCSTS
jgi:hypothetical protein